MIEVGARARSPGWRAKTIAAADPPVAVRERGRRRVRTRSEVTSESPPMFLDKEAARCTGAAVRAARARSTTGSVSYATDAGWFSARRHGLRDLRPRLHRGRSQTQRIRSQDRSSSSARDLLEKTIERFCQVSVVQADLVWTGQKLRRAACRCASRAIKHRGARFVRRAQQATPRPGADLPGFVNAHSPRVSSAGCAGPRRDCSPEGAGSFWTWREAMYGLVDDARPGDVFSRCTLQAFSRDARRGHHYGGGVPLPAPRRPPSRTTLFDSGSCRRRRRRAGVRCVLLNVFYATGGIGKPLERQRSLRFPFRVGRRLLGARWIACQRHRSARSCTAFAPPASATSASRSADRGEKTRNMVAAHAPRGAAERDRGLPARRTASSRWRSSSTRSRSTTTFTAVHCTHTEPKHMQAAFTGNHCMCPLTEAQSRRRRCSALDRPARASARIRTRASAMLEEMRWLEYGQRLQERAARRAARRPRVASGRQLLRGRDRRTAPESLGVPTRARIEAGKLRGLRGNRPRRNPGARGVDRRRRCWTRSFSGPGTASSPRRASEASGRHEHGQDRHRQLRRLLGRRRPDGPRGARSMGGRDRLPRHGLPGRGSPWRSCRSSA